MVASGRLPSVDGLPDDPNSAQFVPLDALLYAPTELEQGRPLVFRAGKRHPKRIQPDRNPWDGTASNVQNVVENGKNSVPGRKSRIFHKSSGDNELGPQGPIMHVM